MEGETVIAGVDTHKDVHVLCLLDGLGRKIWSGVSANLKLTTFANASRRMR